MSTQACDVIRYIGRLERAGERTWRSLRESVPGPDGVTFHFPDRDQRRASWLADGELTDAELLARARSAPLPLEVAFSAPRLFVAAFRERVRAAREQMDGA